MGASSRTSDSVAAVLSLAGVLVVVVLVDFVADLLATDFVPEGAVVLDAGSAGFTGVTSEGEDCAPVMPLGMTGATGCVSVVDGAVELGAGGAAQSGSAIDVREKRTRARRWSRRREACCMVTCFLVAAGQGRGFLRRETRA